MSAGDVGDDGDRSGEGWRPSAERDRRKKKEKKKRNDLTVIVLFFRAGGRTKIVGQLLERS